MFGDTVSEVVVADYLEGLEISLHALCDGQSFVLLPGSQDHKSIDDHDYQGPNTGGMGVIAPVPWLDQEDVRRLGDIAVAPILTEQAARGAPFTGYCTPASFSRRLARASWSSMLGSATPRPRHTCGYSTVTCSTCSKSVSTGASARSPLAGGQDTMFASSLLRAGTRNVHDRRPSDWTGFAIGVESRDRLSQRHGVRWVLLCYRGWRVLSVTTTGDTPDDALGKAYDAVGELHFEGMQYRRDIGPRPAPT